MRLQPLVWMGIAALISLGACERNFLNRPLVGHKSNAETLPSPKVSSDPYIVISFSGGGVRASALAWAVLRELQAVSDKTGRKLTDDIRIVSSASGGSVTAAVFGIYGVEGLPALYSDFLIQDNMRAMELTALSPVTWMRLAGPSFSRIDVFREYIDRKLFHGSTYGRMYARPSAPIILLNATNMASGEVFSFSDTRFDDLCSDLSQFPVAGAVASSAAFPVLLTPISLKNYSTTMSCTVEKEPEWVAQALGGSVARLKNLPLYELARETDDVRKGHVMYEHLLDGGLVDNLGVSSILEEMFSPIDPMSQISMVNTGAIRNLVAIQVIARSASPAPINTEPATPGLLTVVGAIINNPIDSATRGNADNFDTALSQLRNAGELRNLSGAPFNVPDKVYGIRVDPEQFSANDTELRNRFEKIPTSWTMDPAALATVQIVAHNLLYQQPCFVRLREDMAGIPTSDLGKRCTADATSQDQPAR